MADSSRPPGRWSSTHTPMLWVYLEAYLAMSRLAPEPVTAPCLRRAAMTAGRAPALERLCSCRPDIPLPSVERR